MEIDNVSEPSATPPPALPAKTTAGKIFLNAQGLRAGWRLAIYALMVAALSVGAQMLVWKFSHPKRGVFSLTNLFLQEVLGFVTVFGAALVMSRIEKRSAGDYGLPARGAFGKLFWQGCIFGFVEISALLGLIALFHGYSFGSLALHGAEMAKWAILWAIFFVFVALFEEFLFRGYTLYTLRDGLGFWAAAIISSLLFALVHIQNSGEGWAGVAAVFVVGMLWSFSILRTGTLWFALGMHAAFDFGETFFYSVPDSGMLFPGHLSNASLHGAKWLTGGSVGPEASVFDFVLLIAMFLVVHLVYPVAKPQPDQIQQN